MKPIKQITGLILLCLIWGTTWQVIKISLKGLPPFTGAGFRFIAASIVLFLIILLRRSSLHVNKRETRLLLLVAVLTYFIDYGLIYWAEKYLSAGVTAVFFATFPLFTAILSNFVFKNEYFNWIKYLGLMIGFSGITIVFLDQLLITSFNTKIILASSGVIISAVSAAIATVIIKKHLTHINSFSLSFYQMAPGALFLLSFGLISENWAAIKLPTDVVLAVLYLAIIGSSVTFVIYYHLLRYMSAISLSTIIYVTPIVALIADYLFFQEVPHVRTLVGSALIVLGIWITQIRKRTTEKQLI
ncbi:MAG: DMT family transporter [Candidatus Aminicenantes bacterium]|nr:DMT family transporter [Candidatus Aminicenantes bacterium]